MVWAEEQKRAEKSRNERKREVQKPLRNKPGLGLKHGLFLSETG